MSCSPDRRRFLSVAALAGLLPRFLRSPVIQDSSSKPKFKYMLGSCMYGYTDLQEIMPEVKKIGASAIDLWPKVHGNQREQLEKMGEEKFVELLERYGVGLVVLRSISLARWGSTMKCGWQKNLAVQRL